jgi:hypothetical protein
MSEDGRVVVHLRYRLLQDRCVRDQAARMVVSVPPSGLRLASLLAAHLAAT